jgi:hypothetical protein
MHLHLLQRQSASPVDELAAMIEEPWCIRHELLRCLYYEGALSGAKVNQIVFTLAPFLQESSLGREVSSRAQHRVVDDHFKG